MATYVKGDAVANATSYTLHEITNGAQGDALDTKEEINFEVSALGLAEGDHVLAVQAHASGYTSSDISNTVTYTVAAASTEDEGTDSGESETTSYTITYKYVDSSGNTISSSTTESVTAGTTKTFSTSNAPSISGYTVSSVSPTSATINSNTTVTYTYTANETSGDDSGEIDISSLFTTAGFTVGAIYADPDHSSFGGAHTGQTAYYGNTSNDAYVDISEYAGKTLRITMPYAINSAHYIYGIAFYTGTSKSTAIADVSNTEMTYTDGTAGVETRDIVIPATAINARTTWLTPDSETTLGATFSAKIIA